MSGAGGAQVPGEVVAAQLTPHTHPPTPVVHSLSHLLSAVSSVILIITAPECSLIPHLHAEYKEKPIIVSVCKCRDQVIYFILFLIICSLLYIIHRNSCEIHYSAPITKYCVSFYHQSSILPNLETACFITFSSMTVILSSFLALILLNSFKRKGLTLLGFCARASRF